MNYQFQVLCIPFHMPVFLQYNLISTEKLSSDLDLKDNKKIKKQVSRSNRLSRISINKRRSRSAISHKQVSSTMTIFETDGPDPLPETLVRDEEVKGDLIELIFFFYYYY